MHLEYNGVMLELASIDRVDRTAIWTPDGTELLYVEWSLGISCVYHPPVAGQDDPMARMGGTSVKVPSTTATYDNNSFVGPSNTLENVVYQTKPWEPGHSDSQRISEQLNTLHRSGKQVGSFVYAPGYNGGEYAPLTDKQLHTLLSIPRRKLKITMGNPNSTSTGDSVTWLESPLSGFTTDARNGPIVTATPVTAIHGDGVSFGVQLNIVTWLPPCPEGLDRPILAHRWQMTHTRDENDYLTRMVNGEVYFNGAVLSKEQNKVRADFLVSQMFHPIPLGFRRYLGPVKRSPDGLVLSYSYADVDPTVTFDPGNSEATQISVQENIVYTNKFARDAAAPEGGVAGWAGRNLDRLNKFHERMLRGISGDPVGAIVGDPF